MIRHALKAWNKINPVRQINKLTKKGQLANARAENRIARRDAVAEKRNALYEAATDKLTEQTIDSTVNVSDEAIEKLANQGWVRRNPIKTGLIGLGGIGLASNIAGKGGTPVDVTPVSTEELATQKAYADTMTEMMGHVGASGGYNMAMPATMISAANANYEGMMQEPSLAQSR